MPETPEQQARRQIDRALELAGWAVQDRDRVDLSAGRGVAVREFPLVKGHGFADYLLYVDGKAAGVIEAKAEGTTLSGVEPQTGKYSEGLPDHLPRAVSPLPFLYQSTGVETRFTNLLDPDPRSREVFHFHRPETLSDWLAADPLDLSESDPAAGLPSTLRSRLQRMPEVAPKGLWAVQLRAVRNLERSLRENRPRALIQMATGSGKTYTAITSSYRLIKHARARRILFLVDRANLGRQALKEFQQYAVPGDGRKLTELYNVQHLTSNQIDPVSRVVITTIQRLYSMLKGDEIPPELEEGSLWDSASSLVQEPPPVVYNPKIPIGFFDVVFIDECHRSIYTLWRQVVEYFDAFLIGLTATPSKQTFGFFRQNLVMEYSHPEAVADGVNVDFEVYRIQTQITEGGSTVEAGFFVDKRDRATRARRWERLDEDFTYEAGTLDREVVAKDQIRTVVRSFRDKLPTEIFPGRQEVPKTLIYAKDDSHAEDIVEIVREEFGKGNDFAQKITYKTTGAKPDDLIAAFRNSYNPRIVVTVDMIATGTDIKPLEVVMFLRPVKSRNFFEQMKGRGVRVIQDTDFRAVTPDGRTKDHFVLVDCVGVCEGDLADTQPLERKRSLTFDKLLDAVAFGSTDPDVASSLASRLTRLDRRASDAIRDRFATLAEGRTLGELAGGIVQALEPDRQAEEARHREDLPPEEEPTDEQRRQAAAALLSSALQPLATNPDLRDELKKVHSRFEQTIDEVSQDEVLVAGFSAAARERAQTLVRSFEQYVQDHRDDITALEALYSQPYARRLSYSDIKELAEAIEMPPRAWTPEKLWKAYEILETDKVRGASGERLLTDIVSLVRFALDRDPELVPFREQVAERYVAWLGRQEQSGREFTPQQRQWLDRIRDHIAASLQMELDDFDYAPFSQMGGAGKAYKVFGDELPKILDEMNEVLAA